MLLFLSKIPKPSPPRILPLFHSLPFSSSPLPLPSSSEEDDETAPILSSSSSLEKDENTPPSYSLSLLRSLVHRNFPSAAHSVLSRILLSAPLPIATSAIDLSLSLSPHLLSLAITRRRDLDDARHLFDHMLASNLTPPLSSFKALVHTLSRHHRSAEAEDICRIMESRGLSVDREMCTEMIRGYCEQGQVEVAFEVFDKMHQRDSGPPDTFACGDTKIGSYLNITKLPPSHL